MTDVLYARTADGDLAARVGTLVMAHVRTGDGELRILSGHTEKQPQDCVRSDLYCFGRACDQRAFCAEVESYDAHLKAIAQLRRRKLATDEARTYHTPWGRPDYGTEYAPGVVSLSTPGHGGFALDEASNARIDPSLRAQGVPFAFYEEDEQWAIVAFSLPELFTEYEVAMATKTLVNAYPDEYERITGETLIPGQSRTRDLAVWMEANAGRWMTRAASKAKTIDGKVLVTATVDLLAPGAMGAATRHYLVDAKRYDELRFANPAGAYLVDDAFDVEVDERERPLRQKAA